MWPTTPRWRLDDSLLESMPVADWDNVASMILSLRMHLYEYGTIPTWNFMLCHGRPELAVPYSWAWAWPSLFAYTLPPVVAIIAVWATMSGIGFLSTRALLLRWGSSATAAALGASVFVLSGHFAARFNAGHLTFAFYHWVPLLIYLFDVAFERTQKREPVGRPLVWLALTTFLFVSGGLPHALLHFYLAFALFVLIAVLRAGRVLGTAPALRAAALPVLAHGIGIALASYKLLPVAAWQRAYPRRGVHFESFTPIEILQNTLTFVTDYGSRAKQAPWHIFSAWDYNAFVGPAPWLLACVAVGVALRWWLGPSRPGEGKRDPHGAVLFGAVLVVLGVALSMGNDNPASPARLFRYFPILDGIRAFNRYQGLLVFGLAILSAQGVTLLQDRLRWSPRWASLVLGAVLLATLGPLAFQTVALVRNVPVARYAEIAAHRNLPNSLGPPMLVKNTRYWNHEVGHQTAILDRGDWVGQCLTNITLPVEFPRGVAVIAPLSNPPPRSVAELRHDSITLEYPPEPPGAVRFNLRVLDDFEVNVLASRKDGWLHADSPSDGLTVTARYPGVTAGRTASGVALAAAVVLFGAIWRRERTRRPS